MINKVNHVMRSSNVDRSHTCHWPGCGKPVKPAMWGCKPHWFMLPANIRLAIWKAYEPGQEISKNPSEEYLKAAQAAQDWIRQHGGANV
jgi:hypothetical protein